MQYIVIRFSLLHFQDLPYLSIHSTTTLNLSLVNRKLNKLEQQKENEEEAQKYMHTDMHINRKETKKIHNIGKHNIQAKVKED